MAVGSAVRTNENLRLPGLLLPRSWHGQVPGVGYMSVTDSTKNDLLSTATLRYSINNYKVVDVARNMCHLDDLNAYAPYSQWNAICIQCSRLNEGNRIKFTLHIPLWSAGERPNHEVSAKIVSRAFDSITES